MSKESQASEAFTQATRDDEKAIYEIGYLVIPTVAEDALPGVVNKIRGEITKQNAEIISQEDPQKLALAYVIERATSGKREKYAEAYFGWIKFEAETSAIPALEQMLRTTNDILRHLLIETVREDIATTPRRVVFASDRLEGETIQKPAEEAVKETPAAEVSEEDLDKSIEAIVA